MSEFIDVAIHRSAQPNEIRAQLRRCFEERAIDPKFHYTSPRQAQAWLDLHRKYSPYARPPKEADVYDAAFNWVAQNINAGAVHLVSLACGGAGKESRLVNRLHEAGAKITALVSDISVPLVIEGCQTLGREGGVSSMQAVVMDLLAAGNLSAVLRGKLPENATCLVTCFGLMPNVEPLAIAAQLATLSGRKGVLLVGANLVPEMDYEQSAQNVLGQYDNAETRGWLSLLLADYGFEPDDYQICFSVEPCASLPELLQIVARLELRRARTISVGGTQLSFSAGEKLRLFFSNRYTPALFRRVFQLGGMNIIGEWVSADGYEGIIACDLAGA